MTVTVSMQNIKSAKSETLTSNEDFDVVEISDGKSGVVKLFLPAYRGQAVADAISEAIAAPEASK